jgi:hypothetical protein
VHPGIAAAARYAATRSQSEDPPAATALLAIAKSHARDPAIADRLGRDFVARATDAAQAHATLGGLFDALGDRARARAAWQVAVAQSDEVAFGRGLAEAAARAADGPAANVFATQAGAASGDPAVSWNAVGFALLSATQYVDALTAARTAIDLAGPDELARSLDLAIACSRALGRDDQVGALGVQRAQLTLALAPFGSTPEESDALAALAAHGARPSAITEARLWVASRAHPRDVALRAALLDGLDTDDSRRVAVIRELVELAGDPMNERALAAVGALRATR